MLFTSIINIVRKSFELIEYLKLNDQSYSIIGPHLAWPAKWYDFDQIKLFQVFGWLRSRQNLVVKYEI